MKAVQVEEKYFPFKIHGNYFYNPSLLCNKPSFLAKSGAEMDEAFVGRVSPFIRHFYGQPHLIVTLGGDNNFNASNDVMLEVKCVLDHHQSIVEQVESTPKYVSLIEDLSKWN